MVTLDAIHPHLHNIVRLTTVLQNLLLTLFGIFLTYDRKNKNKIIILYSIVFYVLQMAVLNFPHLGLCKIQGAEKGKTFSSRQLQICNIRACLLLCCISQNRIWHGPYLFFPYQSPFYLYLNQLLLMNLVRSFLLHLQTTILLFFLSSLSLKERNSRSSFAHHFTRQLMQLIVSAFKCQVRELAEKESDSEGVFKMLRSDVTRFLTTILIGTTYCSFDVVIMTYTVFLDLKMKIISYFRFRMCAQRCQYWSYSISY